MHLTLKWPRQQCRTGGRPILSTTVAGHRHDNADNAWEILQPILPGGPGKVDYATVSIIYWTIIGLLNVGEVAAIIYVVRRQAKVGQPEASA